MTRPRVGLVGYYGYGNYGDELFLDVYKKYFYDCKIIVLNNSDANPIYPITMNKVDEVDAIIIGGGDLFIPKYFAATYFDASFLSKPIFFHGTGVPLWIGQDAGVIAKMAEFVKSPNVRKINVRDKESADWINKNLNPAFPADHSPDMVFSFDFPKVEKEKGKRIFGLIMRKLSMDEAKWNNIIALKEKAEKLGYEIHNIVLGTGKTRDDDLLGLSEGPDMGIQLIDSNDLFELTKAIGRCDVIASTKFHGCVVATAYGIPAITLSTTDKFVSLNKIIERTDLTSHYIHEDLPERLSKYPAVIPWTSRKFLREAATNAMLDLRRAVLAEI